MNQIYIYDGPFERGDAGWTLVKEAAGRYGRELNLPYDFETAEICRTEKGKPFFVNVPIAFSLSHSGAMWMCLFSDGPCGLDLQMVEQDRDWQAISRRFFDAGEQHYVELWGIEGFYEIWVRKEAFGKCTGQGIFSEMPSMVDAHCELCKVLEYEGVSYVLQELTIMPEVKCAYCYAGESVEPAELRILG